jgi:hypothetical protein
MKNLVQLRRTERFTLLYALYKKANGMNRQAFNLREIADHEGIGMRTFKACFDYLWQENFIKVHSSSESMSDMYYASLTEYGVQAIEEVFADEAKATAYFPSYREMMM